MMRAMTQTSSIAMVNFNFNDERNASLSESCLLGMVLFASKNDVSYSKMTLS